MEVEVEVEVTLRLTVSQSICLGIEYPSAFTNFIELLFIRDFTAVNTPSYP
jgi:hypothetical protein